MKRNRMITRETVRDVFYVDLIAEWRDGTPARAYSTVTLLARLRGWSTSVPLTTAV